MKRFDAHVGAFDGALQQRPEVLAAVGVDFTVHVGLGMVDDTMRTMIHDGAAEHELERYARTMTPSIRDDGLERVLRGETTLEEVLRVTRED